MQETGRDENEVYVPTRIDAFRGFGDAVFVFKVKMRLASGAAREALGRR